MVWRAVGEMPEDVEDPLDELGSEMLREDLLLLGAATRLWLEVEAPEVLPVEDKALYEAANPVAGGEVVWDDAAIEAREDAMVRTILARKQPVAVVILGGRHDLSDNVPVGCEYVRIETREYRRILSTESVTADTSQ